MQVKWRCAIACLVFSLALGVGTWAQGDGGPPLRELGAFRIAATDAQGRFFAEFTEPFPLGVSGERTDPQGRPLAGIEVMIVLEPRPSIPSILGIGHIGSVWLEGDGYDPSRVAGFTIATGPRPVLEIGSIALSSWPTCATCTYQFMLTRDEEDRVGFRDQHCTDGRWGNWALVTRWTTKHASLPEKADKASTWIVVATSEPQRAIYSFYQSDGATWENTGSVEIALATVRPATCKTGTYIQVEPSEGLFITYHSQRARGVAQWCELGDPQLAAE